MFYQNETAPIQVTGEISGKSYAAIGGGLHRGPGGCLDVLAQSLYGMAVEGDQGIEGAWWTMALWRTSTACRS